MTACWRSIPTVAKSPALAESIEEQDDDTNLIAFAMNLFDIIGINQDDRGDNMIVLTPSDHMLVPDLACRKMASPSPSTVKWRWRVKMHSLLHGSIR